MRTYMCVCVRPSAAGPAEASKLTFGPLLILTPPVRWWGAGLGGAMKSSRQGGGERCGRQGGDAVQETSPSCRYVESEATGAESKPTFNFKVI